MEEPRKYTPGTQIVTKRVWVFFGECGISVVWRAMSVCVCVCVCVRVLFVEHCGTKLYEVCLFLIDSCSCVIIVYSTVFWGAKLAMNGYRSLINKLPP